MVARLTSAQVSIAARLGDSKLLAALPPEVTESSRQTPKYGVQPTRGDANASARSAPHCVVTPS